MRGEDTEEGSMLETFHPTGACSLKLITYFVIQERIGEVRGEPRLGLGLSASAMDSEDNVDWCNGTDNGCPPNRRSLFYWEVTSEILHGGNV
ncbi:hypothetical protein HHK36_030171 [Tetracentron sinense]|uniref:Uncharacterized protein n=1 Tax=Tetracentron sinense TaxID=13715 RepID=A0A835D0A1_TETSI|nr:hypothetical protein HHK36_030171 [Tetracentron sinense]